MSFALRFAAPSAVSRTLASRGIASTASLQMPVEGKIVYTKTDEAPALATYSLLPIIRKFTDPAGIDVGLSDISVAGRVLSHFPECLTPEQRVEDELSQLGALAASGDANIIKLPNVSASLPQLTACIAELQSQGYNIPDYPTNPANAEEEDIQARYGKVLGSTVNPVLREGNSDRRAAGPVKAYAQANPKKMGDWSPTARTEVCHMNDGDYYSSEQAFTSAGDDTLKIELVGADGSVTALREGLPVQASEIVDSSRMSKNKLCEFFEHEIQRAADDDILLSLHLKATMMKVSDPIFFGHCVKTYYKDVFAKHAATFAEIGVNANNGIGDVYDKIGSLPADKKAEIEADLEAVYETRPRLAMVDSRKGITNLHVPSDVIIDASMPNVIRDSGSMWNKDDALEEVRCMIPDRCYATMYQAMVEDARTNGQFDAGTMGHVSNVGLMALKAQEYGSHPNTIEIPSAGTVKVTNSAGETVFEHAVEEGDVWRMCQVKDEPIRDWVRLGVSRARATGDQAIFWLDANRAHDAQLIEKVNTYLKDHDTSGLDISIAAPQDAIKTSMTNARAGKNTISITGNVLRDYLTDLFPILELGTSAKMLSIVPMLKGGAMYETGAGGSAPKHVQQFVEEGHLRWDSLGEYLAMAESLADLGELENNERAKLLGETLAQATGKVLDNLKSPSRKVNELDNRGTNFYIAMYWAQAMAEHDDHFTQMAEDLTANEDKIVAELIDCQGEPVDIGGYFKPDDAKAGAAMNPSATLNGILGA